MTKRNKLTSMRSINIILFLCVFMSSCSSQTKEKSIRGKEITKCLHDTTHSPSKQKPDTLFNFSNARTIGIWGYIEVVQGKKIFSEFILSECISGKTLGSWDATEECELQFGNDTLVVRQLALFAIDKNFTFKKAPWKISLFYYDKDIITRMDRFNKEIHYSSNEIDAVIREFETTEWKQQVDASEKYTEEKINLANRLMIAAISGNQKAEKYFKEFKEKFKPDGMYAEWYNEMKEILEYAKQH